MAREYQAVIGIEVHAQLATESKLFCACSTDFTSPPNTNVCPVCLGHPGVLPRLNRQAVVLAVKAARALGCVIAPVSKFARKNYFYPDLPKGYQITMHEQPLGTDGHLDLITDHGELSSGVTIERIHLEEDSGRLIHDKDGVTLIDFNRAGIPLIEIVTGPEIYSATDAVKFLKELRRALKFFGISRGAMEEGSFRCEINISVRPQGSDELNPKVEIKNLNSFKSVEKAINFEFKRQVDLLTKGENVKQETRGWDEKNEVTVHQRFKENSPEYRFFPEPDLPDLEITDDISEDAVINLDNLPVKKVRSLIGRFGVPVSSAELLMSGIGAPENDPYFVASFFEKSVERFGAQGTLAVNLILGTVFEYLNKTGKTLDQTELTPKALGQVTKMVSRDELNSTAAKKVVMRILEEGGTVDDILLKEGLVEKSEEDELIKLVKEVIEANAVIVDSVKKGKLNAIGALVGETMKLAKGQADPRRVNEILHDLLLPKKR